MPKCKLHKVELDDAGQCWRCRRAAELHNAVAKRRPPADEQAVREPLGYQDVPCSHEPFYGERLAAGFGMLAGRGEPDDDC
jgi:hypothetical protein